jgi:hypothetical protein
VQLTIEYMYTQPDYDYIEFFNGLSTTSPYIAGYA